MQITTLHKKSGWQLWERNGNTTYKLMTVTASDYGDNYECWNGGDVDFHFNEIKPRFADFGNWEDFQEFYK